MKTVIANFKSNKNKDEMSAWIQDFDTHLSSITFTSKVNIVLCPQTMHLALFESLIQRSQLSLGMQDLSPFPAGSYTGAISAVNVKDQHVSYAIVGHSERRKYFHETDQDVANKVRESLLAGITPIVCVTQDQLRSQAQIIEKEYLEKILVAFEPIDHIGTGESDTVENILKTHELVKESFGDVPYIYGGSVNSHTEAEILTNDKIDGFLVGTASLDAEKFIDLIQIIG